MNNPLKNHGFRNMLLKGAIFVVIALLTQKIISWFLVGSTFFKEFLDIPQQFQIGKGIIAISITNALIFGVVVFIMLTYKKIFDIKDFKIKNNQIVFIVLAIFFFVLHYLFKFTINRNIDFFSELPLFWAIIKVFIQVLFAAALFIGIFGLEFTAHILKKFQKQIIITGLVTIAFFMLMMFIQNLWTYFSSIISTVLYHVFNLFFEDVTYKPFVSSFSMTEGGGPLLGINDFRAIVGKSCSGIDSFLLFTSLYTLIFILDYKRLKKKLAVLLYFIGVVGMFIINILRILLLFIIGAYIDAKFAIGLFHTNAGWILFIAYFFIYWTIVSKYIYIKGVNK
jgi:exosortase/archaeosortase family protein